MHPSQIPAGVPAVHARTTSLTAHRRPLVMGVVNVTPDSFSDGGRLYPQGHPEAAIAHGRTLLAQGADLLDVGGESTRPGAEPVSAAEELARTEEVVAGLAAEGAVVSIDTTKPEVARAALRAGAAIVNDVFGARDPDLLAATAEAEAGYVLMHMRGTPQDMRERAVYDDVVAEVRARLAEGLERCAEAGVPAEHVVVDPGIGFAKAPAHNLALLGALDVLRELGRPVLVGASRKSFLGALLDADDVDARLEGSLATAVAATLDGAGVLRVHDVRETVRAVTVAAALSDHFAAPDLGSR